MPNDVATLIARIRAHVNVQDTTVLPDADILEALNDAQELLVQSSGDWQGMEQTVELSYGATDDGIALPSGLNSEVGVFQIDATQTDPTRARTPLEKCTRQQWLDRGTQIDASREFPLPTPTQHYYLWQGLIFIVPQPSTLPFLFGVDYKGPPRELTLTGLESSNEISRRYFRTLKWGALGDVYDYLGREQEAELARQRFGERLAMARNVAVAAGAGGPKRIRGT